MTGFYKKPPLLRPPLGKAGIGLPLLIAWRNLVHDRIRFVVTIVGIVFSVVLMGMQLGLLLNFTKTTSVLAAYSQADIFVTAPGVKSVDIPTQQSERRRHQVMGIAGVEKAETVLLDFGFWKRPDGVSESIIIVGVQPNGVMMQPWNLQGTETPRELFNYPDGVVIDKLYAAKLGVTEVGQRFEANGIRVRVVGFTSNIRTFTQSPYVFMPLDMARRLTGGANDRISYVLVRTSPGADPAEVAERLRERLPNAEVRLGTQFAHDSSNYWLFSTGAGISLIMSSVLGLIVGGVIAAQTLYASTIDRLPEYAMLRAIGGSTGYLYRIVIAQAFYAAAIGYGIGILIVSVVSWTGRNASATTEMPLWLATCIGFLTLCGCLTAAFVSLRKVNSIDPVSVFK